MTRSARQQLPIWLCAALLLVTACGPAQEPDDEFVAEDPGEADAEVAEDEPASDAGDPDDGDAPEDDADAGEEPTGDDLNVYLYQSFQSFSPLEPLHGPNQLAQQLVHDNLVNVDGAFEYIPRLASDWEVSEDGTSWTFKLLRDAEWSDGEPFTADDVVFTYELLANAEAGSAQAGRLADAIGFSAPDDHTFVVELAEPNSGFLAQIAGPYFFILPEHVLGDVPVEEIADHEYFQEPTATIGPFSYVEYAPDQYLEVTRNERFREEVDVENVFLMEVTSDVATAQLESGEIDLVQLSPTDMERVEGLGGVTVESMPSAGPLVLVPTDEQELMGDPRVRQAFMHAVDRQGIIDQVLAGEAEILNTHFLSDWALPDDLVEYDYDPERARGLLEDAGWDFDQTVRINIIPGTRDRDQAAEIVQGQLTEIGVQAEIVQLQEGPFVEALEARDFDTIVSGGGQYAVDPHSVNGVLACDQFFPTGGNTTHWCNEDFDALMDAGRQETDEDERVRIYQDAARLVNAEAPYIWLYVPNTIWAYSDRLEGFLPHGDFGNGFWNAAEWSVSD